MSYFLEIKKTCIINRLSDNLMTNVHILTFQNRVNPSDMSYFSKSVGDVWLTDFQIILWRSSIY